MKFPDKIFWSMIFLTITFCVSGVILEIPLFIYFFSNFCLFIAIISLFMTTRFKISVGIFLSVPLFYMFGYVDVLFTDLGYYITFLVLVFLSLEIFYQLIYYKGYLKGAMNVLEKVLKEKQKPVKTKQPIYNSFHKKIKSLKKQHPTWTQQQIADNLECHRSTVGKCLKNN